MKKPFTMKKNSFLSISLLIIWVPVAFRFVWKWISPIVFFNHSRNELYRIIDPSVNSPTYIMVAFCTTLVLIAIEHLRRTIVENAKAGEEASHEDEKTEE